MKESRFIELLNLYVDHQLTPAEAAELESEIQRNPQHRRTYQQYCRMQKACTQLFEKERVDAPASSRLARAMADADRKVVGFPNESRTFWARGLLGTGLAAAAACTAFLLVHKTPVPSETPAVAPAMVAQSTTEPVSETSRAVVLPTAQAQTADHPSYTLLPFRKQSIAQAKERNAPLPLPSANDLRIPDWYQQVELRPINPTAADQFTLISRSRNETTAPGVLRTNPPSSSFEFSNDPLIGYRFTR